MENGGTGTLIPNQDNSTNSTFEEGSQPTINHNYVAEQAFAYAEKNTKLEKLLLYYRMKMEPEAVDKEMKSLKRDYDPNQNLMFVRSSGLKSIVTSGVKQYLAGASLCLTHQVS